jgi:uncharacterized protein (TIGR03435 family)
MDYAVGMKFALGLLFAGAAFAQAPKLEFDVASLRPAPPVTLTSVGISGGPNTSSPDRYSYRGARLRDLIAKAYGLVDAIEHVSGPDWLSKRWDLAATMPDTTTPAQFQEMLRNLVLDRFHLTLHLESKQLPVYELVVAKSGSKLKRSPEAGTTGSVDYSKADDDGFPAMPPGYSGYAMRSGGPRGPASQNWIFGRKTVTEMASFLTVMAGRRIVDKTGIEGLWDARLQYDRDQPTLGANIPDRPVLTLTDALEQQLGLRLVDGKAAFDVVVVENGNPEPDEN